MFNANDDDFRRFSPCKPIYEKLPSDRRHTAKLQMLIIACNTAISCVIEKYLIGNLKRVTAQTHTRKDSVAFRQ